MTDTKPDYKQTINLPKTSFPMKANLPVREPKILKLWQDLSIYHTIAKQNRGKPQYILHDGPPYANGNIHIGHAVNKVLKDIIIKSKIMSGFDAPYVPGWDCHGLPIEHNVEKKFGKAGQKIDYKAFRQKCRDYAARQVEGQKADFVRLGVFGDWDKPYLTMDFKTEANTVRALGEIAKNGYLIRGYKPVYWSVVGGSALAEAEVEYHDKTSFSIDVRYPVVDEKDLEERCGDLAGNGPISVLIWTTTPWTLPSSQAVSMSASLGYVVVQAGEERLLMAEALVEQVMQRGGFHKVEGASGSNNNAESSQDAEGSNYEVVGRVQGDKLEQLVLQHPFYTRQVPVLLGDHVTTDAGTGCVHTAPDHGMEDFIVSQQYGIETLNYVLGDGTFRDDVELFAGEHVYKVDEQIISLLEEKSALYHQEKIVHSYAHCWRTKTPLIYRATPQWFITLNHNDLRARIKTSIEGVKWMPSWGEERIQGMVEGSPDWCVSRQRTWGVPITLLVHKQTQELHPRTEELVEIVAQKIEQEGIDAWFDLTAEELLGDEAKEYDKVTDTLDVWFDSGVTHHSVLRGREELQFPADLYLEGSDQHRGWFQSSLKTSMTINDEPPYKNVLTHGFTVDANGRKMSKSLGNVVSPQDIFKTLGADTLRLWCSSTDYSSEMTISDEILRRASDSYRRIRNTARYLLGNLDGFDASQSIAYDDMLELDQWAVRLTKQVQDELLGHYESFQFHLVYQRLHQFCSVDMGGFYLDVLKDRLYTTPAGSRARLSAQTAMNHALQALVRWIAPILSFTAEEIWQTLDHKQTESIFLSEWYQDLPDSTDEVADAKWAELILLRNEVNKHIEAVRVAGDIGGALDAEIIIRANQEWLEKLEPMKDELKFVFIVSKVTLELDNGSVDASDVPAELQGITIIAAPSKSGKCVRCWHHSEDVGHIEGHEEICGRCVTNVTEAAGEKREFA